MPSKWHTWQPPASGATGDPEKTELTKPQITDKTLPEVGSVSFGTSPSGKIPIISELRSALVCYVHPHDAEWYCLPDGGQVCALCHPYPGHPLFRRPGPTGEFFRERSARCQWRIQVSEQGKARRRAAKEMPGRAGESGKTGGEGRG